MDTPSLILDITSAAAAIGALYYARRSPTQADLGRVEAHVGKTAQEIALVRDHVASVEAHLKAEAEQERLERLARLISITITGSQDPEIVNAPLVLRLTYVGVKFVPTRCELLSARPLSLNTVAVGTQMTEHEAQFEIPAREAYNWYSAGGFVGGTSQKEIILSVHGRLESGEVSRLVRLVANQRLIISQAQRSQVQVLYVEGSI